MKHPPHDAVSAALTRGLAASVLGLLLTPLAYIALGALSGFATALTFVTLPPLLASEGFLLSRLLARPKAPRPAGWRTLAEVASWLVVLGFVGVVSGFTLLNTLERAGLAATCYLVATALSLPLFFVRDTALAQRFRGWSKARGSVVLGCILVLAATAAGVYLLTPPAFP